MTMKNLPVLLLFLAVPLFTLAQSNQLDTERENIEMTQDTTTSKFRFGVLTGFGAKRYEVQDFVAINEPALYDRQEDAPVLNIGAFLDYKIASRSNLRFETYINYYGSLVPTVNLQYGYFLNSRTEAYFGVGALIDPDTSSLESNIAELRSIVPHALLGFRYYATQDFFMDARYTLDLITPTESDDEVGSIGRVSVLYLGVGVRL